MERENKERINYDAVTLLSFMNRHDKQLFHKRKFLMGLSDSPGFADRNVKLHSGSQQLLPESFMRKDDVFYEDVKQLIEKGFGVCDTNIGRHIDHDDIEFCDLYYVSRIVSTLLDDLTNNGLFHLANIVTGDSVIVYKTRPLMKKIIKRGMLDLHNNQCNGHQVKVQSEISQLLKNPKHFRQNHVNHLHLTLKSHHADIMNVLNGLEDMSSQTLSAMYRKLGGINGYVPQLYPPRSGWNRDRLIDRVRKLCWKLIHQLGQEDKLPVPLAKAMAVARLSSRLTSGHQNLSVVSFVHISPEIEALQNEIVKAIWSLGQRIKKEDIRILQHLLNPDSEVGSRGLKTAIKNMLIEFLFESLDVDVIPDSLLDALSVINKTSCSPRKFLSKDFIEEEVELILNMGAHLRQILWDYVPTDKLDQNFTDAYMEELEESDDGDIFCDDDDEVQLQTNTLREVHARFNDFTEEVQSTGDPKLASSNSLSDSENTNESSCSSFGATIFVNDVEGPNTEISGGGMFVSASSESGSSPLGSPMPPEFCDIMGIRVLEDNASGLSMNAAGSSQANISCSKQTPVPGYQNMARNQYVFLQETCDQASVVAYQLIGNLLEGFGQMREVGLNWDDESYLRGDYSKAEHLQDTHGNSLGKDADGAVIVQAVQKVIPSFSNSELESLKKFMS